MHAVNLVPQPSCTSYMMSFAVLERLGFFWRIHLSRFHCSYSSGDILGSTRHVCVCTWDLEGRCEEEALLLLFWLPLLTNKALSVKKGDSGSCHRVIGSSHQLSIAIIRNYLPHPSFPVLGSLLWHCTVSIVPRLTFWFPTFLTILFQSSKDNRDPI